MSTFGKFASTKSGGYVILIGAGVGAAYLLYHLVKGIGGDVKAAAGQAISGATEAVGGIATGRNTVTADTPYEGEGLLGTLGASFDALSGNHLSQFGSWLSDTLFSSDYDPNAESSSIQSATGNPYNPAGPNAQYRQAANNSPVNAQYAASPLTDGGGGW